MPQSSISPINLCYRAAIWVRGIAIPRGHGRAAVTARHIATGTLYIMHQALDWGNAAAGRGSLEWCATAQGQYSERIWVRKRYAPAEKTDLISLRQMIVFLDGRVRKMGGGITGIDFSLSRRPDPLSGPSVLLEQPWKSPCPCPA